MGGEGRAGDQSLCFRHANFQGPLDMPLDIWVWSPVDQSGLEL